MIVQVVMILIPGWWVTRKLQISSYGDESRTNGNRCPLEQLYCKYNLESNTKPLLLATNNLTGSNPLTCYSCIAVKLHVHSRTVDRDRDGDRDRDRDKECAQSIGTETPLCCCPLSWSMSREKFKIFEFRSGQRPGHAPISSIFHFKIINLSWQYSMNIFLPIDINFIWFCKCWLYEITVWKNMLFSLKFDGKL